MQFAWNNSQRKVTGAPSFFHAAIHLCDSCLRGIPEVQPSHIRCPECRAWHRLPDHGFPTNRYILGHIGIDGKGISRGRQTSNCFMRGPPEDRVQCFV